MRVTARCCQGTAEDNRSSAPAVRCARIGQKNNSPNAARQINDQDSIGPRSGVHPPPCGEGWEGVLSTPPHPIYPVYPHTRRRPLYSPRSRQSRGTDEVSGGKTGCPGSPGRVRGCRQPVLSRNCSRRAQQIRLVGSGFRLFCFYLFRGESRFLPCHREAKGRAALPHACLSPASRLVMATEPLTARPR